MKVLCLAPPKTRPERITAFTFVDEEIEALATSRVEVYVLSAGVARDEEHGRIHVRALPPSGMDERGRVLRFLWQNRGALPRREAVRQLKLCFYYARIEHAAAELVRRERIDLIHSHFGFPGGFGGTLASRATGVPLVASFRGMDLLEDAEIVYGLRGDPLYDRNVRHLLRDADRTTYASEFMRGKGIELGAPAERSITILKGVHLDHFTHASDPAAARAELDLQGPVILTVAGLIKRKGIDDILNGLAALRDTHRFTFAVIGEGPELENLKRHARELGLEDRTRFVGRVSRSEIPRYFAACDAFVLASLHEAAGNVLLEAMASGRPVVCTASGGPPEYVRNGETGFVVPPRDPAALAEKLRWLLDHAEARDLMGRSGRLLAEREMGYDRMIGKFLAVYRGVLSDRSPDLRGDAIGRERLEGAVP
jgi:glycosyltransferase involved in cell wall biosynthesis